MDHTQMAVAVFNKYAASYQEKYGDVTLYTDTFDLFCSGISRNRPQVLELACGPGNVTRYLLDRRPDLQLLGTDLAPAMLDIARANNPEAAFQLMDSRDAGRLGQHYDAIMCGFCLPYLSRDEAIQLIQDTAQLLRPGGICCFSTMEDEYTRSGYTTSGAGDQVYLYYHQADYLVSALETSGLRVTDLRRKHYPGQDGTETTDLLILATKP